MRGWQTIARNLQVGKSRKVRCCSDTPSTYINNNAAGISIGPCFRCGHREFEPHRDRSVSEVLRTRAIPGADQKNTATMPTDAVPMAEAPPEAIAWVLRGGLTPEDATALYGVQWHEASGRVAVPIPDSVGDVRGVLYRAVRGERPKYILRGIAPHGLYITSFIKKPVCVITEDVLSALAVSRAGYNAVALLGTSATYEQTAFIATMGDTAVAWLDGDKAGDRGCVALRSRMALSPVKLVRVRTEVDPKQVHRADIRRYIDAALSGT